MRGEKLEYDKTEPLIKNAAVVITEYSLVKEL